MSDFLAYLKSFLLSMKNTFTILLFLFFIGSFFIKALGPWKEQFQIVALATAFLFAGYFAWKRDRIPPNTESDLKISVSEPSVSPTSFQNDGTLGVPRLYFEADISNSHTAVCLLESPRMESFEPGTDLIAAKDRGIKLKAKDKPLTNIGFPMRLEPGDRTLLGIEIELDMKRDDLKALAGALTSLENYALEVVIAYSFNGAEKKEKREHLTGSYSGLREAILKFWKSRKLYELICIAHGIQT